MESVLNLVVNAENVRMLVIVAIAYVGYMRLNSKMDRREHSLDKRIDGVEVFLNSRIDELRYNDLAAINKRIDELKSHLTSTIEALTYALEKNGSMKREDKEYVDSRLAH
ncbi:MAG: hypothetical protein LBC87_12325 [Fibromonadaceae bacterium]|jgi:hypothetical protein|nr:hypothetical protein [Fibromonadaceae bacterium]